MKFIKKIGLIESLFIVGVVFAFYVQFRSYPIWKPEAQQLVATTNERVFLLTQQFSGVSTTKRVIVKDPFTLCKEDVDSICWRGQYVVRSLDYIYRYDSSANEIVGVLPAMSGKDKYFKK